MKIFNDQNQPDDGHAGPIHAIVPGLVPLSSVHAGKTVRVVSLPVCDKAAARLSALGLTPGTELRVIQNLFGPIMVEVRGSRLSLGHGIAHRLLVSPSCNGT